MYAGWACLPGLSGHMPSVKAGACFTGEVAPVSDLHKGLEWADCLSLHVPKGDRPVLGEPCVTFAHLPDGRVYAGNYEGRVIRRLCATAGRDASTLRAAAEALGAAAVEARGDLAYDFDVLGRLRLRLIWYAGDDEFGPSACVLLPSNISSLLCIEDVVVLSERLVSRLSGRRL